MGKRHPYYDDLDAFKERIKKIGHMNSNTEEYRPTIMKLAQDLTAHPLWRFTVFADARLEGGSIKEAERDASAIDLGIAGWGAEIKADTLSNKDSNMFERDLMDAQHEMRAIISQAENVTRLANQGVLPEALSFVHLAWIDLAN